MNKPTIKVILRGPYHTPHVVIQIGNTKTAAHTEPYANRSNARRSWNRWYKILEPIYDGSWGLYHIEMIDETKK